MDSKLVLFIWGMLKFGFRHLFYFVRLVTIKKTPTLEKLFESASELKGSYKSQYI